jgi:hypothetical protein
MEGEQRCFNKLFVEKGMKGVETIDRLHKYYGRDALQRTQVYYWIREVKSGRKDLLNISPAGSALDEGLYHCIAKGLKEDPHLSTRKIAKALNISSATVRNHLTKSLEMKRDQMRWVPHTLMAAQQAQLRETTGSMP